MNINKILSMAVAVALTAGFTACSNEEDDIFNQSAAERLNASSEKYSERLTAQPNGWAMQLYPTTEDSYPEGSGYLVLLDFNPDHMVRASMNNVLSSNVYSTDSSYWEVITDDGPVLSFDTYNSVIHAFSDPYDLPFTGDQDHRVNEQGTGMGGDYEFIIVDAPDDASYMMLKGKKRGTYNLLTPIEEGVDYQQYLSDVKDFQASMFPAGYTTPDILHVNDSTYYVDGADDGLPTIYPVGSDPVIYSSFNPFVITKRGNDYYLRFRDSKTYAGTSFQEFRYDSSLDRFVDTENDSVYIEGNDPMQALNNLLTTGSQRIHWRGAFRGRTTTSPASDSFSEIATAIGNELSRVNRNYGLNTITIRQNNGQYYLSIDYRGQNPATYIDYNIDVTESGNTISFTYTGTSTVGTNMLNRVPSIQRLIDFFTAAPFRVSGGTTNFNLNSLRLTSTADANNWATFAN